MNAELGEKDLATYRLRSQIKAQQRDEPTVLASQGEEMPPGGKNKGKDEKKEKDKGFNMDQLLAHIKEAQAKTEQSLMKAIELSKKEIKTDMEEMSTTLRDSVGSIRTDLNRIEESFGTKIQSLEVELTTVGNKLKVTAGKVSMLEEANKASRNEKKALMDRIRVTEEELTAVKKTHKADMESLRKQLREHVVEQKDQMVSQAAKIDTLHENTLESVDQIKMMASGNTSEIHFLAEQVEGIDNKTRRKSIVIDGLPEKDNEDSAKKLLVEYIQKVIPDFKEMYIESFYRVGKPPKKPKVTEKRDTPEQKDHDQQPVETGAQSPDPKSSQNAGDNSPELDTSQGRDPPRESEKNRKSRPTVVGLSSVKWRDLILGKASDIRSNTGVKGFWINRDQNDNSRRKHQLVKACYNLLTNNGFSCSMKGSIITMRGRQYDYEKLYLLPDPCTPFFVKSRETLDGTGLCFQSEHIFCSNFAPSIFKYDGYVYKTVEHAYQCIKVRDSGYIELAEDLRAMRNPYKVKKLGGEIPAGKKWKAQSEQLMKDLIQAKFDQNPNLRERLLDVPYRNFFEMTGDRVWATGRRISKADVRIDPEDLKVGKNLVGRAITRTKNGFIQEEVRAGRRPPDQLETPDSQESTDTVEELASEDADSTSTIISER